MQAATRPALWAASLGSAERLRAPHLFLRSLGAALSLQARLVQEADREPDRYEHHHAAGVLYALDAEGIKWRQPKERQREGSQDSGEHARPEAAEAGQKDHGIEEQIRVCEAPARNHIGPDPHDDSDDGHGDRVA